VTNRIYSKGSILSNAASVSATCSRALFNALKESEVMPHRFRLDRVVHFVSGVDQTQKERPQVLYGDDKTLRQWRASRRRAAT